jgi:hypothetical protein
MGLERQTDERDSRVIGLDFPTRLVVSRGLDY